MMLMMTVERSVLEVGWTCCYTLEEALLTEYNQDQPHVSQSVQSYSWEINVNCFRLYLDLSVPPTDQWGERDLQTAGNALFRVCNYWQWSYLGEGSPNDYVRGRESHTILQREFECRLRYVYRDSVTIAVLWLLRHATRIFYFFCAISDFPWSNIAMRQRFLNECSWTETT